MADGQLRALATALAALTLLPATADGGPRKTGVNFARYVDPFIGTAVDAEGQGTGGGPGNTFPGPVLPGGMIRMGPDTLPSTDNRSGGYAYADEQIRGFSLKRISGAGCPNYRDVPITPTTAPITSSPVAGPTSRDVAGPYVSTFSHDAERASPGYYRVRLEQPSGDRIDARLTSATRAAAARFTFPATKTASVLVNAAGSANGNQHASIAIHPERREVTGSESSGGFCASRDQYTLYFAIRFDRPFAAHGTWRKQSLSPGSTTSNDSLPAPNALGFFDLAGPRAQAGAYLTFDTTTERRVEMRVGISFVSVENARRNLNAEARGQSFNSIRADARRTWNGALGKIEVEGGSENDRQRFYTALYHSLIEPGAFSDVDGRYPGMEDGKIHTARGHVQYADFSGWDVYRAQMPLLAIIRPNVAADVAQSLLADARQSGWLPKWSVANSHTWVMTGDSAAPTIASIHALGARGFEARPALRAMVKAATQTGQSPSGYVERPGLDAYLALGYVPHELNGNLLTGGVQGAMPLIAPLTESATLAWGSAGTTLEYATDDFAISRFAGALGEKRTSRTFLARSGLWRNLFNSATGFIEPRLASGSFIPGYDPNFNDQFGSGVQGFAEGTAAQYTWMIPHDPAGLFEAMGDRSAARKRLDTFFARLNEGNRSTPHAFLGNEPNSNAPWLYDWLGQPYKAQALVRRALRELFPNDVGGLPGNDDLGQMSAWYVFGALGFYPEVPGTDILALGSPLFPKATVRLRRGELVIRGRGAGRRSPYVQGLKLNGRRHDKPWLRLRQVARGGRLAFELASMPDKRWGGKRAAAPPSFRPPDDRAASSSGFGAQR